MRGTRDLPRRDGVAKGWSRRGRHPNWAGGAGGSGRGTVLESACRRARVEGGLDGAGTVFPMQRHGGFSLPCASEGGGLYF